MESESPGPSRPEAELGITAEDLTGQLDSFTRRQERRRRLLPRAALVGLLAGLLAVVFRGLLERIEELRGALYHFAHTLPHWGILLPVTASAIGAGVALWLVQSLAPEAAGSGIPHLKAVLHRLRGMRWQRLLPVKFASGLLAIGSGLALGREGPTVQMGGAVGQMVARWLGARPRERQTLIAAGAGAGLAAAFNAPLAGVIFVLEELYGGFTPGILTAAFVASLTADLVERLLLGQVAVFHLKLPPVPPLSLLPLFLALGLVCAVVGVAFNRSLLASLKVFERTAKWRRGWSAAAVGACLGLAGWFVPDALGSGGPLIERTFSVQLSVGLLVGYLLLRFLFTMASYGAGTAGGIFAPLLVLGAQAGLLVEIVGRPAFPDAAHHSTAFAVVGMAALFAAIVRAPLTGILLVLEMTENFSLMLPLLAACFTAYGVADLLRDRPIYEALLQRDTLRSQDSPALEGTLLAEYTVHVDSRFVGQRVGDLRLPAGCLLIAVKRGARLEVPTSETVLRAGDHLTAVISPGAAQAASLLHEGTQPVI